MSKSLIILGSSNTQGNTRKAIEKIYGNQETIIDLNDYQIGYFDYKFKNSHDDFLPLIESMLAYDEWVIATPVYWYAMSAIMKTFFDRLSDLLKIRKDLGRQLRGKSMKVIASSSTAEVYPWFHLPIVASAEYLGMTYQGMIWSWVEEDDVFVKKI